MRTEGICHFKNIRLYLESKPEPPVLRHSASTNCATSRPSYRILSEVSLVDDFQFISHYEVLLECQMILELKPAGRQASASTQLRLSV